MNRTLQGSWMAVLCSVALAGCADRWDSKTDDNSGYTSRSSSSAPMSGGTGSMGSMGAGMATSSTTSPVQATYGMVQAIDPMQRQELGLGAVGAAAAGGAAGASADPVYRVTVRMDDGSSQTMVVDAMPPYKVGDRVRYNNGVLSAY